jgi:antitoxin HicB
MSGQKRNLDSYRFTVRPLSKEEGGGFLVEYPDIPGCMSDGETVGEAVANGREALRDCLAVFKESGRRLPKATQVEAAQWRQRLPRTLYAKLTAQAEVEGVSINSLVAAMIAEAVGAKRSLSAQTAPHIVILPAGQPGTADPVGGSR